MAEIEFAQGIYFTEAADGAPEWVLGKISVRPAKFIGWLEQQRPSEKGYVNLQIKRAKSGKPYVALDTWVPGGKSEGKREKSLNRF